MYITNIDELLQIINKDNRKEITDPWNVKRADNSYALRGQEVPTNKVNVGGMFFKNFVDVIDFRPLRNKKTGAFTVQVSDTKGVEYLLASCIMLGLTVAGDDSANVKRNGMDYTDIEKGDFILFGHEKSRFDVDFTDSVSYVKNNNLVPIYDIKKDSDKLTKALIQLSEEKEKLSKEAGYPEEPTYQMLKKVGSSKVEKAESKGIKTDLEYILNLTNVGGKIYPKYVVDSVDIIL